MVGGARCFGRWVGSIAVEGAAAGTCEQQPEKVREGGRSGEADIGGDQSRSHACAAVCKRWRSRAFISPARDCRSQPLRKAMSTLCVRALRRRRLEHVLRLGSNRLQRLVRPPVMEVEAWSALAGRGAAAAIDARVKTHRSVVAVGGGGGCGCGIDEDTRL